MRATRFTDRCTFHGEGAYWDAETGRLLLVDMLAGAVVAVDPGGRTERHEFGGVAAVIRRRVDDGFVLAIEHGFQLLDDDLNPIGAPIVAVDDPAIRMNEGGCDPQGRLYVGTMAYDLTPDAGTLYRLDADHGVTPVLGGITISNGLQWDADGVAVSFNDTPTGRVDRMDFDAATGTFANRRPFISIPDDVGMPDGMAIDADGGIWVALWGGHAVHRYDRDGALTAVVEVPVRDVTCCTFGGPDGTTLFISTSRDGWGDARAEPDAGSVFAAEVGVRGATQYRYAG